MNYIPPVNDTPPPSSGTTDSSGVQAPDGYETDTGQMSSSGRNINTKAEDAKGEVDEVKPSKVTAAEFGTKHEEWHADYSAAIEALGTASTAMCDNLMSFAGTLGDTGTSYDNTEAGATATVSNSGA